MFGLLINHKIPDISVNSLFLHCCVSSPCFASFPVGELWYRINQSVLISLRKQSVDRRFQYMYMFIDKEVPITFVTTCLGSSPVDFADFHWLLQLYKKIQYKIIHYDFI